MANFDGQQWMRIRRQKIERDLLEDRDIHYPSGKVYNGHNYMSRAPKKLFDKLFKILMDQGINKATALVNTKARSKVVGTDIDKYLKGEEPMPLHHFLDILEAMDFKLSVELRSPYRHYLEGNRIVLVRRYSPYVSLNIDTEDIYDFELTLLKGDRSWQRGYTITRITNVVIACYEEYFNAEDPSFVLNRSKIRELVKRKWYREEILYISREQAAIRDYDRN